MFPDHDKHNFFLHSLGDTWRAWKRLRDGWIPVSLLIRLSLQLVMEESPREEEVPNACRGDRMSYDREFSVPFTVRMRQKKPQTHPAMTSEGQQKRIPKDIRSIVLFPVLKDSQKTIGNLLIKKKKVYDCRSIVFCEGKRTPDRTSHQPRHETDSSLSSCWTVAP